MNSSELRLAETLIDRGRLRSDELRTCLERKTPGEGLIDTLVRQGTVETSEIELILAELPGPPEPSSDPLRESLRRLERYVLLGELGRGGMGRVYLAYDGVLKRSVALKAMRIENPDDLPRYRREAEIAASLQHPNIAALYDVQAPEGVFVLSMQYVDGRSLDKAKLETREALEAIAQAAHALHFAHEKGVIHRDVKPENLMRTEDGRVFVLDFGIARPLENRSPLTQAGTLVGTPAYMSPEQATGRPLDRRTDVYSLGATLYALLSGRPPFEGASLPEVLRKVAQEAPAPLAKVHARLHPDIVTIVGKAMSREAGDRYLNALELAREIDRFLKGEPIQARRLSALSRVGRYFRRRPWAIAALAILTLALGGLLWKHLRDRAAQDRLARAALLVEESSRKVEEWDHLAYLPPQDLAPYRKLLVDAEALCDTAERLAGAGLATVHYQRARVLARSDREEEAERALTEAIRVTPEGRFYLDRARLRLRRLMRDLLTVSLLAGPRMSFLSADAGAPKLPESLVREILGDLDEALRRGREGKFERTYVQAVRLALEKRFAESEETLAEAAPSMEEAAERGLLRAWISCLRWSEERLARTDAQTIDLALSARLAKARDHLGEALKIREGDAALYLMRAQVRLHRARSSWTLLDRIEQDKPEQIQRAMRTLSDRFRNERARLEAEQREECQAVRRDVETALRIRPGDLQARLLLAEVHFAAAPFMDWLDYMTLSMEARDRPEASQRLAELRGKLKDETLGPTEKACEEILATAPDYLPAWLTLASMLTWGCALWITPDWGDTTQYDRWLEISNRALALRPQPRDEIRLRTWKAAAHYYRFLFGKGEGEKEAVLKEAARLRELDPEAAKGVENFFPKKTP